MKGKTLISKPESAEFCHVWKNSHLESLTSHFGQIVKWINRLPTQQPLPTLPPPQYHSDRLKQVRHGSHFPSRCSSPAVQTQQGPEISLTSDFRQRRTSGSLFPSQQTGGAALHYHITNVITPIRVEEYRIYSFFPSISTEKRRVNMPIVCFSISESGAV